MMRRLIQNGLWLVVASVCGLVGADEPKRAGEGKSSPTEGRELHVVQIYEGSTRTGAEIHGGRASVTVTRPGQRVILVLGSYDSVTWTVTAGEDTKIEKVFLGGYHRQAIKGLAEGVEVEEAFYEAKPGEERQTRRVLRGDYKTDSPQSRQFLSSLTEIVRLPVSSFFGTYRAERPIVIDKLQAEPQKLVDELRPVPAESLPKLTFEALSRTQGRELHESTVALAEFTLQGPKPETFKPLSNRWTWSLNAIARDPANKTLYGIDNHSVYQLDVERQQATKLDEGLEVPRLSWTCGITFDTKRQRLVVATLGGEGFLYAFAAKDQSCSVIASLRNRDLSALAYLPETDQLLGVDASPFGNRDGHGGPTLVTFNANGAVTETKLLVGPFLPGSIKPHEGTAQLIVVGKKVVLLTQPGRLRSEESGPAIAQCFLVDLDSGKATLSWSSDRK